ncbi:hypothetical protein CXU22_10660 [Akkermansia muciniphila]|uniref:DUF2851 family protein n=1 Tax=Akkermansia muciniphila TaxID=239935 RepID=A0A2N8HB48_9BACT|nr:DUF2851 family protein [Akkermansia muciniphila]PNC17090.1 hypothetical protein CXU22_10660 [Akkermansia muciniphila]
MDMRSMASLYGDALSAAEKEEPDTVREHASSLRSGLPDERTLQLLLLEGRFGTSFTDDLGRNILILDFGDWNKSAGPDFLNARIQIDGVPQIGDIEVDPAPEDWERHGHGSNPAFNGVILHLACMPSRREWFTRNARHERIPLVVIPPSAPALAEKPPEKAPERYCRHTSALGSMAPELLETLLQAAAAYRFRNKHRRHAERARYAGEEQALFESLAETLGYHANKTAMRHLALRAPLHAIRKCPEALLFGAAGFLIPVLPDSCTPEAVAHHKKLWTEWWPLREQFELAPDRTFPWTLSGNRPANHPQRRVGALAAIAGDFDTFKRLCRPGYGDGLANYLSSLAHPYWSTHVTLPSAPSPRPMALMGRDRIQALAVNHLLPAEGGERAWKHYLSLRAGQAGTKVLAVHQSLLGRRPDAKAFLAKEWHHQALLQIHEDLCSRHSCALCTLIGRLEKK